MTKKEKKQVPVKIEYHADDYGMFSTQSRRILDCHRHGSLNGVSVMPNGEDLAACMEMLAPYQKEIELTVHLNFFEGKALADPKEIPQLADAEGNLNGSFGSLLLQSYLPGRKRCVLQLKQEIRAQIDSVKSYLNGSCALRLDGHAHYHMIPVVFDALAEVIREEKLDVSYIRIPREYVSVYLKNWNKIEKFPVINLAKVMILNILAFRNTRKHRSLLQGMEKKVFLGVLLSGRMHRKNVEAVLADAVKLAKKRNCGLELLAHPGGVYEKQDIAKLTNADDVAFLSSEYRQKEASMFELAQVSIPA